MYCYLLKDNKQNPLEKQENYIHLKKILHVMETIHRLLKEKLFLTYYHKYINLGDIQLHNYNFHL